MTGNICGEPNPKGLLCRFPVHDAGLHSWEGVSGTYADLHDSGIVGMKPSPRYDPAHARAHDDLAYLAEHGALAGVAEIIRERRRQVEKLGFTPAHDDRHENGWLLAAASNKPQVVRFHQPSPLYPIWGGGRLGWPDGN